VGLAGHRILRGGALLLIFGPAVPWEIVRLSPLGAVLLGLAIVMMYGKELVTGFATQPPDRTHGFQAQTFKGASARLRACALGLFGVAAIVGGLLEAVSPGSIYRLFESGIGVFLVLGGLGLFSVFQGLVEVRESRGGRSIGAMLLGLLGRLIGVAWVLAGAGLLAVALVGLFAPWVWTALIDYAKARILAGP
jgi:hypothetical protein